MTDDIALPRFARDVRITGRHGVTEPTAGPERPAILEPFGGLLGPGLSTGGWPPPALSHLTLGRLLADSLPRSSPERGGDRSPPTDTEPTESTGADEADTGGVEVTELTVREVIRRVDDGADDRSPAPPDPTSGDGTAPVARELRDVSTIDRRVPRGPRDQSTPDRETRTGGDSAPSGSRDPGVETGEPPGTTEGATASSSDVDVGLSTLDTTPTRVDDRRIPRLVADVARREGGEPSGGPGDAGTGTGPTPSDGPGTTTGPGESGRATSPVNRTVATVLPDFGATDVGDSPGGGIDGGSGARPGTGGAGSVSGTPSSTGGRSGQAEGAEAPAMTVRTGLAGVDGSGANGSVGRGGPAGSTGGRDGEAASNATGATGGRDEGTTGDVVDAVGAGSPGAGDDATVEQVIAEAVVTPRVIDRLHRELQRRRRVERERRGER